jgi:hypothetical protein
VAEPETDFQSAGGGRPGAIRAVFNSGSVSSAIIGEQSRDSIGLTPGACGQT